METLDLRGEPGSSLALAAIAALREAGGGLRLLTSEDPALLMASLDLQLRNAIAWESRALGGHWETLVRLASAAGQRGLVDTLVGEHRSLDEQLGKVLRRLNAGDATAARAMLRAFAAGLRRHIRVENELLAPALGSPPDPQPMELMLREHEELLAQLVAVEESLDAEAWELESYVAMLSGTLAKHEQREEAGLFPWWRVRLASLDAEQRARLEDRVCAS